MIIWWVKTFHITAARATELFTYTIRHTTAFCRGIRRRRGKLCNNFTAWLSWSTRLLALFSITRTFKFTVSTLASLITVFSVTYQRASAKNTCLFTSRSMTIKMASFAYQSKVRSKWERDFPLFHWNTWTFNPIKYFIKFIIITFSVIQDFLPNGRCWVQFLRVLISLGILQLASFFASQASLGTSFFVFLFASTDLFSFISRSTVRFDLSDYKQHLSDQTGRRGHLWYRIIQIKQ